MGVKDIMLDLETLGTKSNSVITAVSLVLFDVDEHYSTEDVKRLSCFRENLLIQDGLDLGCEVDGGAITFWLEQEPEARADLFDPTPRHCAPVLRDLNKWWDHHEPDRIWSHKDFDIPALTNLYHKAKVKVPWLYKRAMDLRTIKEKALLIGIPLFVLPEGFVLHSAGDDSKRQILELQHYWNGISSFAR
jgi:3'-5' exoribonuclease-like protein